MLRWASDPDLCREDRRSKIDMEGARRGRIGRRVGKGAAGERLDDARITARVQGMPLCGVQWPFVFEGNVNECRNEKEEIDAPA